MIVTLDGQRVDREFSAGATLQAVINGVRETQCDSRLIVGVVVNGEEYGEAELNDSLQTELDDADQVDLETSDPLTLGATALHNVAEQITAVGEMQAEIGEQINAGNVGEAVHRISEFVRAWQLVHSVLTQLSQLTGQDLTQETFDGQPVSEYLTELLDRLRDVRDALDAQDMVLLGDLVHYETPTLCETWSRLLEHLAETLTSRATPSP